MKMSSGKSGPWNKRLVLILIALALGCLALLPGSALADGPKLSQIEQAISEKGLNWTAKDYGRTFPLGALLDDEEKKPEGADKRIKPLPESALASLPASVDWRTGNWVSPVKDQGNCGSCWAFAGVGAVESLYAIANNSPGSFLDLAEQILVSCCSGNYGCEGGYMSTTARFLRDDGTYYESCFPYTATDSRCSNACDNWEAVAFKIDSYQWVQQSVNALKTALQDGPLQVAFDVYADFDSYGGGVYEYAWGGQLGGHAVLLVGYQNVSGQYGGGYFVVKNSWGTSWGENGYFRIGYSQVTNRVDFGTSSYRYAIGDNPTPTPDPSATPGPSPTPGEGDAYEPDDTRSQASPIVSGERQTHSIRPAGDVDWCKFVVGSRGRVVLETTGVSGGDTELYLYDNQRNRIAYDDDGGTDLYSRIVETLNPGTYYVKVDEYWGSWVISTYHLEYTASGSPTPTPTPAPGPCDPPEVWTEAFGVNAGNWTSQNRYPRMLADVDGDGKADIAGMGQGRVVKVALSTGSGFGPARNWIRGFSGPSWPSQNKYPRMLADVNNDGKADLIGFAQKGTFVSLSTGSGFAKRSRWSRQFRWPTQSAYPRMMADVNGDGMADVVGFHAEKGVFVALSTGNGFTARSRWSRQFKWSSQDDRPRLVADVNNDGLADIVGFASDGVHVALSTGNSFGTSTRWISSFRSGAANWPSQNITPRMLADVNDDGQADIVGFGKDGVKVSLSTGSSFASPTDWIQDYGANAGGWTSYDIYPRAVADVDGDGKGDIVGFGDDATYVSLTH